ncbi:MSMEG_0570 family nitrogen starvation response protein [Streptomyces ipomoeae]|uniref:MSMEG_0570 family nitrogen starvation response protein n=1 Tax=Streptomyces ipomoeae TaxID=103232 RepID=UPI0011462577|nr:MSMEG_0570 family nitrogen starvation response protein [Streptomyces ipomoeae]MDX2933447.1 MSMEG_0570 family nitrogen starvation response protein [Streptomyces ipomoeae]TQE20284.1 MSMEG_0570 family nitrogen starvation response protein [Streptomyces ipomoeae]
MPETYFHVRWPDGVTQRCYSPSTVVEDYFTPGGEYELADFVERSRTALGIAGERVKEKFGFYCTGASDQLAQIEQTATAYTSFADAKVIIESLTGADGSPR